MYTVLPKTDFDFSVGSISLIVGRLCSVPARTPARLAVRVHANDLGGSTAELRVRPTLELPGTTSWFTAAESWLSVVVDAGHTAPSLLIASQSRPLPPSLCAEFVGTKAPGNATVTLSAELIV